MDDDLTKHLWRIRPNAEIGLADPTGGPGGPSLPGVFAGRVRPANQNVEMFTPQQPDRRNVLNLPPTPEQAQRLTELGFKDFHLKEMSREHAQSLIDDDAYWAARRRELGY